MVASKKLHCAKCSKKCSGNVLKYQENYYHNYCLTLDDQIKTNTSNTLESIKDNFKNNNIILTSPTQMSDNSNKLETLTNQDNNHQPENCAGCLEVLTDGDALIALDAKWHVSCFKCTKCGRPLHNEFVAKDGKPYCENDYQELFGLTCVYCKRFICGKVLQAGNSQYFHPTCARCYKCGDTFLPGEEMYLQGEVIWHPRCGPDTNSNSDDIIVEGLHIGQYRNDSRAQSPSLSSGRSRSTSPFSFASRQYERPGYADSEPMGDLSRFYTSSYLTSEPNQNYLRRPLEPYPPKSPQFSRPPSSLKSTDHQSRSSSRSVPRHAFRGRSLPRAGMQAMLDSLKSSTPRSKSPCMLNEEPIELSHYPGGRRPKPDEIPKIERDDFPAPPFPYAADRLKKVDKLDDIRTGDADFQPDINSGEDEDPQLKKEEQELSKIASGIGKIFLKTVQEREKFRKWKRSNIDPRNASRTPSATRELHSRLRYINPTNASPSRDLDRVKIWDESEHDYDYSSELVTRSGSQLKPTSQLSSPDNYKIISSLRSTPRPGYGVKSDLGYYEKNRSNQALTNIFQRDTPLEFHDNGVEGLGAFYNPYLRRSLPNVNQNYHHIVQEGPLKFYPYHVLMTCNFRLPPDVDRCHLERHLSDEEFHYLFRCDRLDFYRMPEWRRNELKRRIKLF